MVFILLVYIQFNNKLDMEYFIKEFQKLQEYCLKYEKNILYNFEHYLSEKDENKILIFEKYNNKQNYSEIHRNSQEFKSFKQKIKNINMKIEGESFLSF